MQEYLADLSYVVPFIKPNQAFPKGRMFYTLKAYMPFFKKAWLYFVLVEILLSNILPFGKAWLGLPIPRSVCYSLMLEHGCCCFRCGRELAVDILFHHQ